MKRIIKLIGLLCMLILDVVVGQYAITNFILCYSKTIGINVYGLNITGDGIVFFVQFLFLLLILLTIYYILLLINKKNIFYKVINYASIYWGIVMIVDVVLRLINYNEYANSAPRYLELLSVIPYLISLFVFQLIKIDKVKS